MSSEKSVETEATNAALRARLPGVFDEEVVKEVLADVDEDLVAKFVKFHFDNPQVYVVFRDLSAEMKATGKAKYGARTIIEIVRWRQDLVTEKSVFKFNNDFSPLYARLLMHVMPVEFGGFFELRRMKPVRQMSWEELRRRGMVE